HTELLTPRGSVDGSRLLELLGDVAEPRKDDDGVVAGKRPDTEDDDRHQREGGPCPEAAEVGDAQLLEPPSEHELSDRSRFEHPLLRGYAQQVEQGVDGSLRPRAEEAAE